MASNNVALTAIGMACIAAAGAGGYFALRQNPTPNVGPANAVVATTPATDAPTATAERSVQETEAVVSPTTKTSRPAAAKPAPLTVISTPLRDSEHEDYGGAFDGFNVTSDADPGL